MHVGSSAQPLLQPQMLMEMVCGWALGHRDGAWVLGLPVLLVWQQH